MIISFGKYRGAHIDSLPNSYLNWLLDQNWFELEAEFDEVQEEIEWRKNYNVFIDD